MFDRMVDRGNFAVTVDRSFPIDVRASMVTGAMQPLAGTLKLYLSTYVASNATMMGAEVLDLQCLMLHATRRAADTADEFPVPENGSEKRAAYDAGLAQMRRGVGEVVVGALRGFEGAAAMTQAATTHRARFAACLADEVPGTLRHLTEEGQIEVRNLVRHAAEREPTSSPASASLARLSAAVAAPR